MKDQTSLHSKCLDCEQKHQTVSSKGPTLPSIDHTQGQGATIHPFPTRRSCERPTAAFVIGAECSSEPQGTFSTSSEKQPAPVASIPSSNGERVISPETSSRLMRLYLSEHKIADGGPAWVLVAFVIFLFVALAIGGLTSWLG